MKKALFDLSYAPYGERSRFDLYLPEDSAQPAPLVLAVHGGGWRGGSRGRFRWMAEGVPLSQGQAATMANGVEMSWENFLFALEPLKVHQALPPEAFDRLQRTAYDAGFAFAACAPLIRSSYHEEGQSAYVRRVLADRGEALARRAGT